jgi:glyoxylase-like metal-dependent hydrolase (beta-lactamase superfamily II)
MKIRAAGILAIFAWFACAGFALAQDLGPNIKKFGEGIYVYVGKNFNSNSGIILTQDGVVVIDTGQNPVISREIAEAVKKLTPMPVRFVLDTEPHPDPPARGPLCAPAKPKTPSASRRWRRLPRR